MSYEPIKLKKEYQFLEFCDFCAKPAHKVFRLVASKNGTHICDECTDICAQVVAEERAKTQEGGE